MSAAIDFTTRTTAAAWPGRGEPHPFAVLTAASLAGLAVLALYRYQHEAGPWYVALFAKEGPLEQLTFVLALLASAACAHAVWRFSRPGRAAVPSRPARWAFGALALTLFAFGMEEINWSQTLFGFATPEGWKAVNLQQETSVHNVLDRNELEYGVRILGLLLTASAVVLAIARLRTPQALLGQIAPHPALLPLAFCIAYASVKQHSEVVELLISIFFAFYAYRLFRCARYGSTS